jgi:phage-related protein
VARVIGEASIRLTVEGAGLGAGLRKAFQNAAREAAGGGNLLPDLDKNADSETKKVEGRFKGMFGRLTSAGQSFGKSFVTLLAGAGNLVKIGVGAGAAVAGVTSLAQGLIGLVGVIQNASGAAALLPAAFAGFLAVSATIKLATKGIGDSFKALASGDAQKFAESLKDLSPNAQAFVKSVAAIKPAFDSLQLATQDALFANLGKVVSNLGATYLPMLRQGFTGIAGELNTISIGFGKFASDSQTVSSVGTIFQNVQKTVAALGPSVTSLVSAFLDIGTVGSQFLPGLANGFSVITDRFAQFIAQARQSGALADFIQTGIDTLKQLGQVIGNVFGILKNVMDAANISGGGFLNNLIQITGAIKDFTGSAEGSKALNTFFTSMSQIVSALLPIFLQLAGIIGTTVAPILANLVSTIGPALTPVVTGLGQALQLAAPGIAALGQGFATLFSSLGPVLPAIGQLAAVLGASLGAVLQALAPVLAQVAGVLAGVLAAALPPLVPVLSQLGTLFGGILTAVLPLLPPLIQLASAVLQPIIGIVQALVPPFTALVQNVLKALQPIIPVVASAFEQLGAALAPLAGALGEAIVQIFSALLPAIGPLINAVVALVQAFLPLIPPIVTLIQTLAPIIALFVQIGATFIAFIANAITPVINVFGLLNTVVGGSMNAVLSVISGVVNVITTIFSGLLTAVTNVWGSITGSISNAVNNVKNFISNGFNAAVNAVKTAFNNIVNAVSSGVSSAVSYVSGLPGKILGAIGNFASLLFNAGADLLRGLISGISSMIGHVISSVVDVGKKILGGIKGALGINSPSREAMKLMGFFGDGLVKGLDQIAPKVENAAGGLGDSLNSAVATRLTLPQAIASGPGAAAAPAAGNTLYQTNVMLPGTDVRQFSDQVLRRANTDLSSGASSLPVQRQGVQVGVNDGLLAGVTV